METLEMVQVQHKSGNGCLTGHSRIKAEECCSVRTSLKHTWVLTSH